MSSPTAIASTPLGAGTAPPTGQGPRRSWHLWANAVVLSYVALAVIAVALQDWPALPVPRWLAVHLLLLGAATNAILTWTEHFAVALMRARKPSRWASAGRLAALNLAIVGVLVGVGAELAAVTVAAATLLGAVVVAHLVALLQIARRALMGRFAGTVRFYVAAGLAFVVGISFGALLAVDAVPHRLHDPLHAAHVHANVFGWVGLTVLGTLFTLWPTVLRTRMVDHVRSSARRCLLLTTTGLAVSVTGLAADLRWVAVAGLATYGAGVVVALQPFLATWRRKAPRDGAAWSLAAGTGWLVAGVVADLVLLSTAPDSASYLARLDALIPPLAVGFVLQTLLGALTYLLPVIQGGGPAAVRAAIARLSRWWRVRVIALNAGALLLAGAGALNLRTAVTALGLALAVAPVVMFLGIVVGGLVRPAARSPLGSGARSGHDPGAGGHSGLWSGRSKPAGVAFTAHNRWGARGRGRPGEHGHPARGDPGARRHPTAPGRDQPRGNAARRVDRGRPRDPHARSRCKRHPQPRRGDHRPVRLVHRPGPSGGRHDTGHPGHGPVRCRCQWWGADVERAVVRTGRARRAGSRLDVVRRTSGARTHSQGAPDHPARGGTSG